MITAKYVPSQSIRKQKCQCESVGTVVTINGVPAHAISPKAALARLPGMLNCQVTHVVNHVPADPFVIARRDDSFREVLQQADLNLPDGMGVVWAARILGVQDLRERVYGPDFMLNVISWGIERGVRHAFVGGSPSTLEALLEKLTSTFPRAAIVAAYSPPMRSVTERGVREDLAQLEPEADIIWVGLGTPKQQFWADFARKMGAGRIIFTVGAAFDFVAAMKPQAPRWMQRTGLEWLFRLGTEPRRLWRRYILGNPLFIWSVLVERCRIDPFKSRRAGKGRG